MYAVFSVCECTYEITTFIFAQASDIKIFMFKALYGAEREMLELANERILLHLKGKFDVRFRSFQVLLLSFHNYSKSINS